MPMLPIIILNDHQQLFNYLDIKHSSLPALLIVTALHHDQHSQTGVDRLIEFITKAAITETKVCNQTDQLKSALSECGQTTLQRGWKQNTEKHRTDQQLLQCDANVKGVSRLGLQPKEKVYVSLPKHTYLRESSYVTGYSDPRF
jgi:hypothetical protein